MLSPSLLLLPPLTPEQDAQREMIRHLRNAAYAAGVPIRTPHHTIGRERLIGPTGDPERPAELELARGGVLVLQDFAAWKAPLVLALAGSGVAIVALHDAQELDGVAHAFAALLRLPVFNLR